MAESQTRHCFRKYVFTKVLKRLEVNKVRSAFKDPPKTILLSVSLGISSITMLHILDEQLRTYLERNGRPNYSMHVLYVALDERADPQKSLDLLKERFPLHTYSMILLEDVFDYDPKIEMEIFDSKPIAVNSLTIDKYDHLKQLLTSLPSSTSRADIANILRLRLTSGVAKQMGYNYVLYGDSTTRLAERTLAETAKGRGGSLPWLIADGLHPDGPKITYPMRDLLKKEIETYATLTSPPLTNLVLDYGPPAQTSVSSKATTIDTLMSQYFESVEQNYPSIVANVVRTSSKLILPSFFSSTPLCKICKVPIVETSRRWGGDQDNCTLPSADEETISRDFEAACYGCARSIQKGTSTFNGRGT